MHQVQHAGRQTGFIRQFDQTDCAPGDLVGRLEDKGIPARNRQRKHPQRDHQRKIKGSYSYAHANGMACRPGIHAGADPINGIAHHERWRAAGELDALDPALERSSGFFDGLAIFFGNQRDQFAGIGFQGLTIFEQHFATLNHRGPAPGRKGIERCTHRCRNFFGRTARYLGDCFAGCRVVLNIFGTSGYDRLAIDKERTRLQFNCGCYRRHGRPSGELKFYTPKNLFCR